MLSNRVIILFTLILITNTLKGMQINSVESAGNSVSLVSKPDSISAFYYNPSLLATITRNSFLKANIMYVNNYDIEDFNTYAGNIIITGIPFINTGISLIYTGYSSVINITEIKIAVSPENLFHLPVFKTVMISAGVSAYLYSLNPSGYQIEEDSKITSKKYYGMDAGIVINYKTIYFGITAKSLFDKRDDISGIITGITFDFPKYSSKISIELEPVKRINTYNRDWLGIKGISIGKGYYPVVKIGIEKIISNLLIIRLGLRDFKPSGGAGIKFKGFSFDYSIVSNQIGLSHFAGITIWQL